MRTRDRRLAWVAGAIAMVVVAVGIGAVITARSDSSAPTTTPSTTPATTAAAGATAPLTGLPMSTAGMRPVLGVKVDEAPGVTTFPGMERADLIYEELVEGGITRCLALFQSQDAPVVGPVRSLRTSDFDLAADLGHPIIAFSGADALTLKASKRAPFVPYTPDSPGASEVFHRDTKLRSPHNLFLSTDGVRANTTGAGDAVAPFTHATAGAPAPAGLPAAGIRIRYTDAVDATFAWDATRHQWLRWAGHRKQVDGEGTQLGVDTVLVLEMAYGHPAWDPREPELDSVGNGYGLLLHDGIATPVRWQRPTAASAFTLNGTAVGVAGQSIALPAGRTWVALPQPGATTVLDAAAVTSQTGTGSAR